MKKRIVAVAIHTVLGALLAFLATISTEWPQLLGSYLGHMIFLIAGHVN